MTQTKEQQSPEKLMMPGAGNDRVPIKIFINLLHYLQLKLQL
jgi:hypothetical protein